MAILQSRKGISAAVAHLQHHQFIKCGSLKKQIKTKRTPVRNPVAHTSPQKKPLWMQVLRILFFGVMSILIIAAIVYRINRYIHLVGNH
jgi:hypothetical protein